MQALSGQAPAYDTKNMLGLASILKKAEFGAIFVGIGLTYSIKNDFEIVTKLADMLPKFNIMPMVGHYNMRGFNEALLKETGFVNRVKFDGKGVQDNKYAIIEALQNKGIDALVVIGSDPALSLPRSVISHLPSIPVICIDPCQTFTSRIATVTIPSAATGVESAGSAVRMDGKVIGIKKIIENNYMSDEDIMKGLMEAV
jgi:formylmethanofuran dehydrogenase subunit B